VAVIYCHVGIDVRVCYLYLDDSSQFIKHSYLWTHLALRSPWKAGRASGFIFTLLIRRTQVPRSDRVSVTNQEQISVLFNRELSSLQTSMLYSVVLWVRTGYFVVSRDKFQIGWSLKYTEWHQECLIVNIVVCFETLRWSYFYYSHLFIMTFYENVPQEYMSIGERMCRQPAMKACTAIWSVSDDPGVERPGPPAALRQEFLPSPRSFGARSFFAVGH
jgi:hypothetical protein